MTNDKDFDLLFDTLFPPKEELPPGHIPIDQIHPFPQHPYKVEDNEEMAALTESIREQGILTPLLVRCRDSSETEYEVISGHRRLFAARKAGLSSVPARISEMDRNAAAIALVDSNLHRERLLPSEKAFAYKMKMEAMKRQGRRTDLTSGQVGTKLRTDTQIAENADDSARQIQRYIRLTNLIPELLDLMDQGKIAFSVGVELSYLDKQLQHDVLNACEYHGCTPSYAQAVHMRRLLKSGFLDRDEINRILSREKPNQKETIRIDADRIRAVIPQSFNAKQREDYIVKALEYYHRHLHRQREER